MSGSILVVCVGNICRSLMAEVMLQAALPDRKISSAGIGAMVGHGAHPRSVELMAERGLDLSNHVARQLDDDLLSKSEMLITMEQRHTDWITRRWPQALGRVFRWGHWEGFDVPDPFRRDEEVYLEAMDLIDLGLKQWVDRLQQTAK